MTGNRFRFLGIVAFLLVLADQASKRWVVRHFENVEGRSEEIIPGVFDLVLTRNPGAAWGLLGDLKPDGLRIAVFVLISIGAVGMVVWLARRAKPEQLLLIGALSLVLGGALGNLIDRVLAGKVIDFLDFYTRADWMVERWKCGHSSGCHWPAFNVADICISTGVFLLIVEAFVSGRDERAHAGPPAPARPADSQPTEPL